MRSKEEAIKNLKQYIEQDLIYKENKPQSDFDEFCINHCRDIETVLNYIEELEKEIEELKAKLEFKQFGDLDNAEFEKQYISTEALRKLNENTDTRYDFAEEVLKLLQS